MQTRRAMLGLGAALLATGANRAFAQAPAPPTGPFTLPPRPTRPARTSRTSTPPP